MLAHFIIFCKQCIQSIRIQSIRIPFLFNFTNKFGIAISFDAKSSNKKICFTRTLKFNLHATQLISTKEKFTQVNIFFLIRFLCYAFLLRKWKSQIFTFKNFDSHPIHLSQQKQLQQNKKRDLNTFYKDEKKMNWDIKTNRSFQPIYGRQTWLNA